MAIHPILASRLTAQMSAHITSWVNHQTPIALRKQAAVILMWAVFMSSP